MIAKLVHSVRSSIHKKLLASYFVVIALPLLLIGSILFFSMLNVTERQTLDQRAVEMKLVSQQLQAYTDQLELYSRVIYTSEVQQLLNAGPPSDPIARTRWKSALFQQFEVWYGYMNIKASIQNVTIVRPDGTTVVKEPLYAANPAFADESWYREAIRRNGEVVIVGPFVRSFATVQSARTPNTFSLIRKINNSIGSVELGGIVIDINVMDFARLMDSLNLRNVTIINADNRVVYSDRTGEIGQELPGAADIRSRQPGWGDFDGERMFVNTAELPATGWLFISLDPLSSLAANSVAFRNITVGVGLLAMLLALLLSTFIAGRITKPLRTLQQRMRQVQLGRFDSQLDVTRTDEVGRLTQSFNQMTERIETLVNDVYKSEITRKDAQLKALHSQINPHFLYNTLDSMNALAMLENVPLLARMSKMLADMFRYSISQGEQIVPLREELNQVKRYFEIQQIRYDHKFKLMLSIPDRLLDYAIPKLSLQPVVENAVYHGLELSPEGGFVAITVYETAEGVVIEVFDNGGGIKDEELARIRERMREPVGSADHLGLANVQERMQLHYGAAYGIDIESVCGKGTSIVFRLPPMAANGSEAAGGNDDEGSGVPAPPATDE
ncbi:sensor histidine kinase [Paenibacillus cymbidii]|uniref:sensor histidine kinase n=1 Tax=Paenibacillus cymbidii TaxID=1639034 RepID=UPI001081083A|nr:sensor histidine kinase [Paenibacillus cymbidii]